MPRYTTRRSLADVPLGGSDSYPCDERGDYLPKIIPIIGDRAREDLAYFRAKDGTHVVRADRRDPVDLYDPLEIRIDAAGAFDAGATLWAGQPHRMFKGYAIRWNESSAPIPADARSGGEPFIE